MQTLFAHGEPICKTGVRYNRITSVRCVRYKGNMTNNIKRIRKAKGMTAEQVFTKAGISRSHFSDLENGKKPLNERTMASIAKALEVEEFMLKVSVEDSKAAKMFDDLVVLDDKGIQILEDLAAQLAEAQRQAS